MWIQVQQELRHHPKTRRLSRELNISERDAVGMVVFLWWWCIDYAKDGNLSVKPGETKEGKWGDIAEALGWDPSDADALINALIYAGFLDSDMETYLTVHDWNKYTGKLLEEKERQAEYMRNRRAEEKKEAQKPESKPVLRQVK